MAAAADAVVSYNVQIGGSRAASLCGYLAMCPRPPQLSFFSLFV